MKSAAEGRRSPEGEDDHCQSVTPNSASRDPNYAFGRFSASSASHRSALPSEGARQSPRGDSEPPDEIFGPLGSAERLNWLVKKRRRKSVIHLRISSSVKARLEAAGTLAGQAPLSASCQAFQARKAIFEGR